MSVYITIYSNYCIYILLHKRPSWHSWKNHFFRRDTYRRTKILPPLFCMQDGKGARWPSAYENLSSGRVGGGGGGGAAKDGTVAFFFVRREHFCRQVATTLAKMEIPPIKISQCPLAKIMYFHRSWSAGGVDGHLEKSFCPVCKKKCFLIVWWK